MIAICRNLTGCLIATFLGVSVPMSSAQERPTMPAMQPHAHPTSTAPSAAADAAESQFLAANEAAMGKMMADMTVRPTGDVDRDFVAMMVPHHQGAIDMAETELRYGRTSSSSGIAQEIIVDPAAGDRRDAAGASAIRCRPRSPRPPSRRLRRAAPRTICTCTPHGEETAR